MRVIQAAIAALILSAFCNHAVLAFEAGNGVAAGDRAALAAVLAATCDKSLVVLGEASHGDGHGDTVKVALVRELVGRCGFKRVLFESGIYEFIPISRNARQKIPVSAQSIATAVGALWKFDRETQPLFDFLATQVNAGKIEVGGIDFQAGGFRQPYSNDVLMAELTAHLPAQRATYCKALYHSQIFGGAAPDGLAGAARVEGLQSCLRDVAGTLEDDQAGERVQREAVLRNLHAWLSVVGLPARALIQARDRMMFQNTSDVFARMPPPGKIIIWTHNAHAARSVAMLPEYGNGDNLGSALSRRLGGQFYALAITARAGQYRWSRTTNKEIAPPPADALEARFGASDTSILVSAELLKSAGTCPAGVFGHVYVGATWADAFDGVLILDREYPPQRMQP